MYISIPSILIALGGKCLLNWMLVFSQKKSNVCQSFMGVLGLSLALVDTVLTLTVTALHVQADVGLLGVRLTRHHVCLLVQVAGQIYSVLQWPVVVLGFLDIYVTVTNMTTATAATSRLKRVTPALVSALLWCSAIMYSFLLSEFRPVTGEEPPYHLHQCWVYLSSQNLHVGMAIILAVACALVYSHEERWRSGRHHARPPSPGDPLRDIDCAALSRRDVVRQVLTTLLHTWAWFLALLVVLLLLPFGIPGYLCLNVPWLCFLNSVLTAFVLGVSRPALRLARGLAAFPLDSLCDWRLGSGAGT